MKHFFWYFFLIVVAACNADKVNISGHIENAQGVMLVCEKVRTGKSRSADTIRLAADGNFAFRINMQTRGQDFLQLKLDTLPPVMLLATAGENVLISANAANFAATLKTDCGRECSDFVELQKTLWATTCRMDSLARSATDEKELQRQASRMFVSQKRASTEFIVRHIGSLTAAAAYFQKINRSLPLFGYSDDRFLLSKMLDSLRRSHPKSPYMLWLETDLDRLNTNAAQELLQERINAAPQVSKPEIALPDINGRVQSLNSLMGNVTLLQFWSARQPQSRLDNRELLNLYSEFSQRRFKIYQVSLDTDSVLWRNTVLGQGLMWINVCSFDGVGCKSALSYNVSALPSNFLINRQGEIVAKNLFDKELRSKITELVRE